MITCEHWVSRFDVVTDRLSQRDGFLFSPPCHPDVGGICLSFILFSEIADANNLTDLFYVGMTQLFVYKKPPDFSEWFSFCLNNQCNDEECNNVQDLDHWVDRRASSVFVWIADRVTCDSGFVCI